MAYDVVADMFAKLTQLAIKYHQPLIILENPRYAAYRTTNDSNLLLTDPFIMTIGKAAVSFESYSPSEMVDIYADLRSQLEAEAALLEARNEVRL